MTAKRRAPMELVVCIQNEGYAASLERRKLYRTIPDAEAEKLDQIRVVDESGEDYLYPKDFFIPVKLPRPVERAVIEAA